MEVAYSSVRRSPRGDPDASAVEDVGSAARFDERRVVDTCGGARDGPRVRVSCTLFEVVLSEARLGQGCGRCRRSEEREDGSREAHRVKLKEGGLGPTTNGLWLMRSRTEVKKSQGLHDSVKRQERGSSPGAGSRRRLKIGRASCRERVS